MKFPEGLVFSHPAVRIDSRSQFELPVVVQARLAPMNRINVGCFTGVYGGKLGHCSIGRYCSIAPDVDVASDQHPINWLSSSMIQYVKNIHGWGEWLRQNGLEYFEPTNEFSSNSPVEIGNDVWIGQGAFLKSGVKIGDGAVVASHSVVIEDVPAYAIVAGVPAKIKKMRFSDNLIDRLLLVKWWQFNVMGLQNLNFSNIEAALGVIQEAVELGKIKPMTPRVVTFGDILAG